MATLTPAASTVLVVDDDEGVRELIAFLLNRAGYRAVTAADGLEAIDLLATTRPDLVVLDMVMPGLDGLSVCARIHSDTPVVMMSGRASKAEIASAFESGAVEYLDKPVHPGELVSLLRMLLK
ncbi:response regulator [Actinoplanes sp. NPDC051861]|uniref:response regulator transcription factor n=1 Tax=Actinoplanes sp. NPDC051861 TaxID=3155170 RepID=UPI003420D241